MLYELGNDLKKILLAGIGAAAVTAEKSQEVVRELVRKGELTMEQGKALNEELKHKAQAAADERRRASLLEEVEKLSPEDRAALKHKLEQLEAGGSPVDENGEAAQG